MKLFLKLYTLFLFSPIFVFAQNSNQKIKVILIGTFHYGQTSDKGKTSFTDLFSDKRQSELDDIATKLSNFGVKKFFIETQASQQKKVDSLFSLFQSKKLVDTVELRDEQVQIAFRTALKNKAKLVATDNRQELPYDKINAYEEAHKNDSVNTYPFFDIPYPFTTKRKKLSESVLSDYYIQLNNIYSRQVIMYDYLHYALSYGKDADFTGVEFTLSWYDRNLKIFTNILRNTDYKDDKVVAVLYGSSHTAVLRHFFEDHPAFEVVDLDTVFKN